MRSINEIIESYVDSMGISQVYISDHHLETYVVRLGVEYGIITEDQATMTPWSFCGNAVAGIDELSTSLGVESNTLRNSIWGWVRMQNNVVTTKTKVQIYADVARFIGFMYAIDKLREDGIGFRYPALHAINKRAFSGRGHNSPATGLFIHEYAAVKYRMNGGAKSPGALERKIWAVREAAQRKHGVRISFEVALEAIGVVGLHAVSKAATVAYATTLGLSVRSYREARAFVVEYLTAKAAGDVRVEDGVKSFSHFHIMTRGNVIIEKCWYLDYSGYRRGYIITHSAYGSYHSPEATVHYAMRYAMNAFRARARDGVPESLVAKWASPDSGVLVTLDDSYNAGNCMVGTEEWMKANSLDSVKLLPLFKLIELAGDYKLANNVIKEVVLNLENGVA